MTMPRFNTVGRIYLLLSTLMIAAMATNQCRGEFRSINGLGNNEDNTSWGAAETLLLRQSANVFVNLGADYPGDQSGSTMYLPGSNPEPLPSSIPNARTISNMLFTQSGDMPNGYQMSAGVWQWGQFVDHDIDLTRANGASATIMVEQPDPDGMMMIPFNRSEFGAGTGTAMGNPRQQVNAITSYIDASTIYGSDATRADALRTFSDGRLKTSAGGLLLPLSTDDALLGAVPNDNGGGPATTLFVSGDIRANEQTGLTAMHTLFMREHNRIADGLAGLGMTDEEIYQTARKVVGAEVQQVTYNEFLPAMLGSSAPRAEDYVYDPDLNAGIKTEFSTAAYRVGHTMLNSSLIVKNPDTGETSQLSLRDAFFQPDRIINEPSLVEKILMGLTAQPAEQIDARMVDDVRTFLFGFGGLGIDLAALNIQRGRDHGLPSYNVVREAYGLPAATTFQDISTADAATLEAIYADIGDVGAWVGALAEDHVPDLTVGELVQAVLVDQFTNLRDGDRFFYMNEVERDFLEQDHIQSLVDVFSATLVDIITWNTPMDHSDMPRGFFVIPEPHSAALLLAACGSWMLSRRRRRRATPGGDRWP